jgi:hypothetical protein
MILIEPYLSAVVSEGGCSGLISGDLSHFSFPDGSSVHPQLMAEKALHRRSISTDLMIII